MNEATNPVTWTQRLSHFLDHHMFWSAVGLSLFLHVASIGVMHIKDMWTPAPPPPKQVAKVRILSNPNGNPNVTTTKVVEIAKPKTKVPKPNSRAIVKQDTKEEPPATEVTNDLPQSFGDDPTGGVVGTGVSNTDGSDGVNANAEPIERVKPEFPQEAALKGIEGWVLLRFDINEEGRVENISVVDASPRGMFDKKAKEAIRKWKYAPRMVQGQVAKVVGREVQIDFKLTD